MEGYAALIESSEFDWSEAKLSCYARILDDETMGPVGKLEIYQDA